MTRDWVSDLELASRKVKTAMEKGFRRLLQEWRKRQWKVYSFGLLPEWAKTVMETIPVLVTRTAKTGNRKEFLRLLQEYKNGKENGPGTCL